MFFYGFIHFGFMRLFGSGLRVVCYFSILFLCFRFTSDWCFFFTVLSRFCFSAVLLQFTRRDLCFSRFFAVLFSFFLEVLLRFTSGLCVFSLFFAVLFCYLCFSTVLLRFTSGLCFFRFFAVFLLFFCFLGILLQFMSGFCFFSVFPCFRSVFVVICAFLCRFVFWGVFRLRWCELPAMCVFFAAFLCLRLFISYIAMNYLQFFFFSCCFCSLCLWSLFFNVNPCLLGVRGI